MDACCDFGVFVVGGLKKARGLLHVILLPEGEAVELLQGHSKDLLEVRRREVSLKGQNTSINNA